MPDKKDDPEVPRLEVYLTRSILFRANGIPEEFKEGDTTIQAKERLESIRNFFDKGFLTKVIEECKSPDVRVEPLDQSINDLLERLVDSVTSEVGRAIVGLTILQLSIKAVCPEQSVRLHKGGGRGTNFSWADGIPMRVLDKQYNTPILRKYDLLRLNADGVFMTRSLAENYPYSKLYKAALRGARTEWLEIVDLIESRSFNPADGLKHLIMMLLNRTEMFKELSEAALNSIEHVIDHVLSFDDAIRFIKGFVDMSTYSARVFEIAMHSFFQVLEEAGAFSGHLKPLSQMRSANKKHGNIGDIEITDRPDSLLILESWDAKYGKPYLRDELDELDEKLRNHPETKIVGFVVDSEPNLKQEITSRITEIELVHSVSVQVISFDQWIHDQVNRVTIPPKKLAANWVKTFAECLCQHRRKQAPIDEPSDTWVSKLNSYAQNWT